MAAKGGWSGTPIGEDVDFWACRPDRNDPLNVDGQLQLHAEWFPGEVVTALVDVTCLDVWALGPSPHYYVAFVGGVITESSDPWLVGMDAIWMVEDNNPRRAPMRDQATDIRVGLNRGAAEYFCAVKQMPQGDFIWMWLNQPDGAYARING